MALDEIPTRGSRPRNRRALITAAATELFHRRGFDQVGMSDIAEAVGIGPSALYRHFSGKQDLLHEVITTGLASVRHTVADLDLHDRDAALTRLAAVALEQRPLGVLWQREARHLTAEAQSELRAEIRALGGMVTDRVRAVRPELSPESAGFLAWAIVSVLSSNSFHRLTTPDHGELLAGLVNTVLDAAVPTDLRPAARTSGGLVPSSRRVALLIHAVRLFARHGYTNVGIEDIGAAVGIAGASVYHHFPTKLEMLAVALDRATAALFVDLTGVLREATGPADALTGLARSYVRFTLRHQDYVGLLITEVDHLSEEQRHAARRSQHEYIGEWVELYLALHPGTDPVAARIRVQAALTVANDAARTFRQRFEDLETALEPVFDALLT